MKWIAVASIALLIGLAALIEWTIVKAMSSGGQVIVDVNAYGEGLAESIIVPIIILLGIVTLVWIIQRC